MFQKIRDFLTNISGVAIIEFAMVIIPLMLFAAGSVDVYSTYNIKSKAQDAVQNIALGVSKTDLSQVTVTDAAGRVQNMLAPYNVPEAAFRFDLHTTRYENGTALAPATSNSGTLGGSAFTPCTTADLNLPATLIEGYADIISAQLCVNPELIQPTILGNLLNGAFNKDANICQRVCTLGQNTLRSHEDIQTVSQGMNSFGSSNLNSIRTSQSNVDKYETTLACRMVITDIPFYGPCDPAFPALCTNTEFHYEPTGFSGKTAVPTIDNGGGLGKCRSGAIEYDNEVVVLPVGSLNVQTNVTVEMFNGCNINSDETAIDTQKFSQPDDTRATGVAYSWDTYETVCADALCTTHRCDATGSVTWEPKGACAAWTIVSGSGTPERSDLRNNGVFYDMSVCPHPRSENETTLYGTNLGPQDGCTRVLVPNPDPATNTNSCDLSNDFTLHDNDGEWGMMEWNRMRREIYHVTGYQQGYDGDFGMQYYYDNFQGDTHYNGTRVVEGVWINQTGSGNAGRRPPDGPYADPPGTNTGGGGTGDDFHNRFDGNPLHDEDAELGDCPNPCL